LYDIVFISVQKYDHLSLPTPSAVKQRHPDNIHFFAARLFKKMVLTSGVFSTGGDSLVGLCRVSVQLVQKIVATTGNSVYRLVYSVYSLSTSLFTALSTLFMGSILESRVPTANLIQKAKYAGSGNDCCQT
jgi:hypothetical protein